ncbi:MAG: DNA internalization-related competence protein ComEC/Rec2 [Pseudomonadota bacterium]
MFKARLLGMIAGVGLAAVIPEPIGSMCIALSLASVCWLIRGYRWSDRASSVELTDTPANAAFSWWLGVSIGMFAAAAQFASFIDTHVERRERMRLSGCVVSDVQVERDMSRFVFAVRGAHRLSRAVQYRTVWYRAPSVPERGSCWRLSLTLKPPRGTRNESGFDYERWLFAARISGLATVVSSDAVRLPWRARSARFTAIRDHIHAQVQQLTDAAPSSGLIQALATGRRGDVSETDWQVLRRSGTAHLMAISGLHIGLAAGLGYGLGRFAPIWIRPQANLVRRGMLTGLVVALCYAALAGFAISTLRAFLMLCLWTLCRLNLAAVDTTTTLLLTAAVVLIVHPWMILSTGFWLSVGAVLAILIVMAGRLPAKGFAQRCVLATRLQLGLMLLMMPITLLVTHGVSWISLPVNVVLIPLFSVAVVPLVLVLVVSILVAPWASDWIATLTSGILNLIWQGVTLVASKPWAFTDVTQPTWLAVPITLCALSWLLPAAFPARRLSVLLVLPLFVLRADSPALGEFRIDVLDVGQALSVVIQTRHHTVVYDTGNAWPGGDSAQQTVIPALARRGVGHLDALIVSHADRDHAGGVHSLIEALSTDRIWVGEPMPSLNRARPCRAGLAFDFDKVHFRFLHPPTHSHFEGNDASCALLVQSATGAVLFTGDLNARQERRLLPELEDTQLDLIIGAHHGSVSSSDPYFAAATTPRFVVFSNGYENQWGMPRDRVIRRWSAVGAQVLTTAEYGQMQFLAGRSGTLELARFARQNRLGVWRWRAPAR